MTGSSGGPHYFDYATIKYNTSGVQQWVAYYDGPGNFNDYATALVVDAAGNVYVTGSSEGSSTSHDYATIKYNASGVQQWVTRYNGPISSVDRASALAVDAAGNVYVTGYSLVSITSYDYANYATIKYNASGVQQWVARYGVPGNSGDQATALAVDAIGNVYVTGSSRVSSTSYYDYATIKYNASGVQQWVARYDGPGNSDDYATALAVDAAGNVYVTGSSIGSSTSYDYATIKYNVSGVQQWVTRYDGPGNSDDQAKALAVDAAGNVYVTGYSNSLSTLHDYAKIKYNASGVQQWVARYNGLGNSNDQATALAVDATRNVYVTGTSGRNNGTIYTTIGYFQRRITTNSATNVDPTFAILNATVNPDGLSTTVKFQYGTTTNYGSEALASPNPVMGNNPVSVSAKVNGLIPDTLYHFRIVATNNAETIFGDDQSFTTLPCGSLTIVHTPVSLHDVDSSITATVQISGACSVDSVVLKYRRGGDKSFSTAIMSVDSLYRWTIPADTVTSRGVEYFIAATDTFNATTTREPRAGVFSVQVIVPAGEQKASAQPSGSEQNAYRLISVPLNLDDKNAKAVLEDNLGLYNKKKWRLFSLRSVRPDSQAYVEYSDTLKMDSGKAFLLIVKDPGKFIDTGAGKSNRTDKPFSIVLQPEWNLVGNPFNFPIPLKNLSLKSGTAFALRYHEET